MIEVQLTLEALGGFNSPVPESRPVWRDQLMSPSCGKSVNSSVTSAASVSCLPDSTFHANHHFLFATWTLVPEIAASLPTEKLSGEWGAGLEVTPAQRKFQAQAWSWSRHTGGWQKIYIHSCGLEVGGRPVGNTRRNGLFWRGSFQVRKWHALAWPRSKLAFLDQFPKQVCQKAETTGNKSLSNK